MMSEAIIHGIILAFGLIIPLGVQNVFVFNQGASQPNIWRAAPVVLTASICDTLLILIAVQGVSLVLLTFSWLTNTLYIIGFFFLLYMGFVIWRSNPSNDIKQENSMPLKKANPFCCIGFVIKSTCNFRYNRCNRNKFYSIHRK